MSTSSILLVMADRAHARIYRQTGRGMPLSRVQEFEHAASTLPEHLRLTDRPGRTEGRFPGRSQELAPHADLQKEEALRFARELRDYIEQARARGEFAELVLIANPRMLGLLREELSSETARKVSLSLDQDLMHLDDQELAAHLKKIWWVPEHARSV